MGSPIFTKAARAAPGYYAATLEGTGIRAELIAGEKSVMHRYSD